ncbi:MAG: hypothetical protein MJ059_04495 [Lachnospiraceae bacterium]|nr:hypothetical protein [Lachnospiraceae bacterium]
MKTTVYTATLNDRFTLKSGTLAGIKSSASRIANRGFRPEDRMVVTGREDGELVYRFVFKRKNMSGADRGEWIECIA